MKIYRLDALRRTRRTCVGLLSSTLLFGLAAAPTEAKGPQALVTILDGDATVLRGADSFVAAQGLRLDAGTIIETSPRTLLLRLELRNGGAIDLGPDTQAMLLPIQVAEHTKTQPMLYLLKGWVKVSTLAKATISGVLSPAFQTQGTDNVEVAFVGDHQAWVFLESGNTALSERSDGRSLSQLALGPGEFYTRSGTQRGTVLPRLTAAMLEQLPRAFRDTLPLRAAAFQGRDVKARALGRPTYAQLQHWFSSEPALRDNFPHRFAALAVDPEFRSALIAHLSAHPEWRSVLFPPPIPTPNKGRVAPKASSGSVASRPAKFMAPRPQVNSIQQHRLRP